MTTVNDDLKYHRREIGGWSVPVVEFTAPMCDSLRLIVVGTIVNSVTERTGDLKDWKRQVTCKVKEARGEPWASSNEYAISLGLAFHPANHGNRTDQAGRANLDVENFIKPIIDAIAAGIFCEPQTDPRTIDKWDYDDSNFDTLLIHRLPDAEEAGGEGVAIFVSAK